MITARKYGYGRCQVCIRTLAATKKSRAFRHGHTKKFPKPCKGSGEHLLEWCIISKWDKYKLEF